MGAIVTATDVRPAVKEQVASLGAKFLAVEDEEFKAAETAGGYAKEMSKEYQAKQAALTAEHIAKQDIVITTALIPGRPAPKLVSAAMVASMKPGSVLVDLAVERGGNVEGAEAGKVVTTANGVKIVGHLNVPGRVAASASLLYAKNLFAFLETMVDKTSKQIVINRDDELVKATMLTDAGKVVHPNFASAAAAAAADKPKPIVAGQNRGDDPASDGAAKAAPKKAAAAKADKPAAAKSEKPAAAKKPAAQPKKSSQGGRVMEGLQKALDQLDQAVAAVRLGIQDLATSEAAAEAAGNAAHAVTGGAIDPFVFRFAIFVLAIFVGYYVVWQVTPALHTPLMAVTNAISSVIVVGALLAVGIAASGLATGFGFVALVLASVNIFGGFLVTQRMLAMYKKKDK